MRNLAKRRRTFWRCLILPRQLQDRLGLLVVNRAGCHQCAKHRNPVCAGICLKNGTVRPQCLRLGHRLWRARILRSRNALIKQCQCSGGVSCQCRNGCFNVELNLRLPLCSFNRTECRCKFGEGISIAKRILVQRINGQLAINRALAKLHQLRLHGISLGALLGSRRALLLSSRRRTGFLSRTQIHRLRPFLHDLRLLNVLAAQAVAHQRLLDGAFHVEHVVDRFH